MSCKQYAWIVPSIHKAYEINIGIRSLQFYASKGANKVFTPGSKFTWLNFSKVAATTNSKEMCGCPLT